MEEEYNLWHYTTLGGLKGILESNTLWATDYRYLNDFSELEILKKVLLIKLEPIIAKIISNHEYLKVIKDDIQRQGRDNYIKSQANMMIDIFYKSILDKKFSDHPMILSFSNLRDSNRNGLLSQWRGYGSYALIFNKDEMIKIFAQYSEEYKCEFWLFGNAIYSFDDKNMDENMKKRVDGMRDVLGCLYEGYDIKNNIRIDFNKVYGDFLKCMIFLKHNGFFEENEFRFCVKKSKEDVDYNNSPKNFALRKEIEVLCRSKDGLLIPYVNLFDPKKNLPIKKICVGPHLQQELRKQSLEMFLQNTQYKDVEVFCSDIPYIG